MKILVVGLGNPGDSFLLTRHNVGFMVLDRVAKRRGLIFTKRYKSYLSKYIESSVEYILMKPQTYMNLSGEAVRSFTSKESCDIKAVVYDDIDLPLGAVVVKRNSSSTHNGIRSINDLDFIHIRVGIGRSKDLSKYVLEKFSSEELRSLDEVIDIAILILEELHLGVERVASKYNRRRAS